MNLRSPPTERLYCFGVVRTAMGVSKEKMRQMHLTASLRPYREFAMGLRGIKAYSARQVAVGFRQQIVSIARMLELAAEMEILRHEVGTRKGFSIGAQQLFTDKEVERWRAMNDTK